MNTVTDLSELCTRVVTDRDEIDRLRRFQRQRYFEGGLIDELPTHLPDDPKVAYSTYFGVYSGDEIQATARIVKSPAGPPMFAHHRLYPSAEREIERELDCVAEVSRLAVGRTTPHYRALSLLAREFLRHGLHHQEASLLVASVEKPLVRILNRLLGVPMQIIGPQIDQYGEYHGETVPVLIDTVRCLDAFRAQKSRRWEFFVDGLVIDLTNDTSTSTSRLEELVAS